MGTKTGEYGEKGADRCGKGYCVGKTPSPLTPFKTLTSSKLSLSAFLHQKQ